MPVLLLLTLLQASPGGEWRILHSSSGTKYEGHGLSQDFIGDVDGDGVSDLVVSSPYYAISDPNRRGGAAFLYSGRTGALLDLITGDSVPYPHSIAQCVSRMGDVTGDGIPEVAISKDAAGGSGQLFSVQIYSVLPFTLVYESFAPHLESAVGSYGLAGDQDLNGDGWPDSVAGDGAYKESGVWLGAVHAFNGLDGSLLWRTTGVVLAQYYGQTIACPGDVDGDGHADVLTRSYLDGGYGTVHVLSGLDGSEMYRLTGDYQLAYLGLGRLAGCGDADGDGLPDFIIGQDEVPGVSRGLATIHRGFDGSIIHRWEGPVAGERFGATVAGPGDLDGDGFPDYAVGAPHKNRYSEPGRVYVFSGRDFSLMELLKSPAPVGVESDFGYPIASFGADLNADGAVELLTADVNEPAGGVFGAGTSYLITFDRYFRADTRSLDASSGGTLRFTLDFPATEAGLNYRLLASDDLPGSLTVRGVKIPLVWTALLQKFVNNPPPVFDYPTGTLDANGDALVTAAIPANALAAYVGRTVKFAAVSLITPSQPSLSSAAAWIEVLP